MLRWGILGTSFISDTVAQAIVNDPGSSIQAVAGRRQQAVDQFSDKFPVATGYTDFQALINDPEVDLVYVGLPNHLHHQYIIAALEAGKHVLGEKSLSIDMDKTQQIVGAVKKSPNFFIEGLMYLHHPLVYQLQQLIQDKAIGELKSISGSYCADIAQFVNPDSKGAIYNLGCYPISLMHLMIKTAFPESAFENYQLAAQGNLSEKDHNICNASLSLKLSNGLTARIHTAETYGMAHQFTLIGDKGTINLLSNPWLPEAKGNQIELKLYDQPAQLIELDAEGDAFLYQTRQVREAIEQGRQFLPDACPTIDDSQQIMQLLTGWESAARTSCG